MSKPYKSKNPTLEDETPKFMWALMGKLVPQLPGVVTFVYDLHFRHTISRWKCIFGKYTLYHQIMTVSTV
jgi:hypothetical protein